jgi:multiple sugar transport system substrate-binding protein
MIITGSWVASRLRTDLPDLNFGVAPIPYHTVPATYGVIDTLVMFRTSRDKELAWEYLEFLFDDDRRFTYVTTAGVLPGLISVAERPEISEDPDLRVFLELLPDARFEPLHPESEAIAQSIINAVVSVHSGRLDPQAALDEAVDEIDGLLQTTAAGW